MTVIKSEITDEIRLCRYLFVYLKLNFCIKTLDLKYFFIPLPRSTVMTSGMKTMLQEHEGGEGTDVVRTSTPGIGKTKKPINPSQAAEGEQSGHRVVVGGPRMKMTNLPSPRSEVKSVVVCRHVVTGDKQIGVPRVRKEIHHKSEVIEKRKERGDLQEKKEINSTIGL